MPVGRGCSRSDYCSSWAPEAIKNRVRSSFINCLSHQSVSTDSKDLPLSSPFIISLRLPLNLHFQTPRGKTLIPLQPGKKPNFDKRLCKQQFLYTCKRLLRFPDTSFDHWVRTCCCIWFRHIALSTAVPCKATAPRVVTPYADCNMLLSHTCQWGCKWSIIRRGLIGKKSLICLEG